MPDALLDVGHHSDDDPNQDFRRRIKKSGNSGEALPREQMCKKIIMDAGLRRPGTSEKIEEHNCSFLFRTAKNFLYKIITPELRCMV